MDNRLPVAHPERPACDYHGLVDTFKAASKDFAHECHGVQGEHNRAGDKWVKWVTDGAYVGTEENELNNEGYASQYIQYATQQGVGETAPCPVLPYYH